MDEEMGATSNGHGQEKRRGRSRRTKRLLVFLALILLLIGAGVFAALKFLPDKTKPHDKLNAQIQKNKDTLTFSPFYYRPAVDRIGGPKGYVYKDGSAIFSPSLLSFQFIDAVGKTIEVTQQARPANFDAGILTGRDELNVETGRAILGQNEFNTSAAIAGEKTLLFLKAQYIVDDASVKAMLSAFTFE